MADTATLTAPARATAVDTDTSSSDYPFGESLAPADLLFSNEDRSRAHDAMLEIPAYAQLVEALQNAQQPT